MISYGDYPRAGVEDIVRLRRVFARSQLPARRTDHNLIIATWNLRAFGRVNESWGDQAGRPKRNLRALAAIAEVIRQVDVIAIQEVQRDTTGIRLLVDDFLGPHWGVLFSDVTAGDAGNNERLAYIYDSRRVTPSGLAGEIVLPPGPGGSVIEQFDRTPYIVGFKAGSERFALLTVHIRYGKVPTDRLPELRNLARYAAAELRERARTALAEERNVILLGDFNIDKRQGNPLFEAFVETGLWVPEGIRVAATTYGSEAKHYDQIAWFRDDLDLLSEGRSGVLGIVGACFPELSPMQMSYRLSDHFPLWVEFLVDRSGEAMARVLGVDPAMPDPFQGVPGP